MPFSTTRNTDKSLETESLGSRKFPASKNTRKVNLLLWIIQGLLALIFLFTGGMKLLLPIAEMTQQTPLTGMFLRFLGVAELLGAFGLILPGLAGIQPGLTPLAAAGLVIIMIGASVITVASCSVAMALVPPVAGILAAFVAYEHQEDTNQIVRVWGDTAVATAFLWEKGVEDGKSFNYKLWFSNVYVRTPSGWRYVFGQAAQPLDPMP